MDTDWCLNCERSFQGIGPYCSFDCQHTAGPVQPHHDPDVIYHSIDVLPVLSRWSARGPAGIRAWAADIEPSSPPGPSCPPSRRSSKPSSPRPSTSRLPALMHQKQRPAPPALSISTTSPSLPSPSRPIRTPPQPRPTEFLNHDRESISQASLASGATESSLATPASASLAVPLTLPNQKTSILATLANQVCSWVAPTPPVFASSISSQLKQPFTLTDLRTAQFTVVAHTRHSPALDIYQDDSDDDKPSVWHLSRTIAVDPPPPKKKFSTDLISRPRGRKLFRS